jgi:GAF domain-containing protein
MAIACLLLPALALRHWLAPPVLADSVSELVSTPYASGLGLELSINCLAALAAFTLARSLRERNRAERVQWDSMEAVRALSDVLTERRGALSDALPELLLLGCQRLGLELGVYTRLDEGQTSIVAVHGALASPIKVGDVFELSETLCNGAVQAGSPLAIEQVSGSHWASHAEHSRLGIESYLGGPVSANGAVVGTLYFASREPRALRFTGVDKQLLGLMSEWLGSEVEREQLANGAASNAESRPTGTSRLIPRRSDAPDRRRLDVNGALLQLESELRNALGSEAKLELSLAPLDPIARLRRHDFDRVLWSLLWNARDASGPDAILSISTDATGPPPGAPAAPPFVTLTISVPGPGLVAGGVERLFDDRMSAAPIATQEGRLSLPRAQRLLQASDGDVSVHSDPLAGTTLTAYLPGAPDPERAQASDPAPR